MTVRLGTRVPDTTVHLGAAILSGGGSPPAPATMPSTALYLPGTTGNYVSTPDDASLDITTSAEIVVRAAAVDWSPASPAYLVGKENAYGLRLDINGRLTFLVSSPSLSLLNGDIPPLVNGTAYWIKVTFDTADPTEVRFYYAADQDTEPSSWTTAGSASTSNTLAASANDLVVGSYTATIAPFNGTIYHAIVRDGVDGTLIYEADFSHPWVGNRYTDSTGKVSTINGSAWAWEIPE